MFGPKHRLKDLKHCHLQFDRSTVSNSPVVKNLCVHLDEGFNIEKHVRKLVKSCYAQLRSIGRIRPYFSENACKTLVATLVKPRMDYGNSLLHGINNNVMSKLRKIQNSAARLVKRKRKYDHITPDKPLFIFKI